MDRKSLTIIAVCIAGMLLWSTLVNHFYPPVPVPVSTNNVTLGSNSAAGTRTNPAETAPSGMSQGAVQGTAAAEPEFVVRTNIPEELLVITNENARYTFTSRGGGLKEVDLVHYPETVSATRRKKSLNAEVATLNSSATPPVFAILGDAALQGDGVFKLAPITNGVRAEMTNANGLAIIKDFQLGTNYLVSVSVRFKNVAAQPIAVPPQEWVIGTATPMSPQDNGLAESVLWYNGSKSASVSLYYFNPSTNKFFVFPRTPETAYKAGSNNVFWASAQNQFFALAAMPDTNKPAETIVVRPVDLPRPSQEEINNTARIVLQPRGMQTALAYPGLQLAPGQEVETKFNLFAGPKEYETLAYLAARFKNDIDLIMGFGWFGWISKPLLVTMNWLHRFGLPYGWIIILTTIIIRGVYWPLTRANARSMKRMQALQPQLKALQEKYKDDPQKQQQKVWEFYRKNGVNPLSSCLPMFLQVPVFIGFYTMLRSAIELRGAPFLWIGDLSQPDTVFVIPGFNFPVNIMPLIMAGTQFWQASMTPPSPGMDPSQQKIMRYIPLIMVCVLYNYSSGLALYWTTSNLLTILQTRLTKSEPVQPAAPGKAPVPVAAAKRKK